MSRPSRLVSYLIIGFTLSRPNSSQQNVINGTDNGESGSILHQNTGMVDIQQSHGIGNVTTHNADIAGYNREKSSGKTHLEGEGAPNSLSDIDSIMVDLPGDYHISTNETVVNESDEVPPDLKASSENTDNAEEGFIRSMMNWILGTIQTDFNFVISCGTVLSSLLTQIIPLHTIMAIRWNRSTGNLKTLNFVTVAFANFLWSLYGFVSSNTVIILSSFPGFLLSCCYIVVFHKHCEDSHQMHILRTFYKVAVVSCLMLFLIYLDVDPESYLKFIGLFGGSIQGFSYITPLLSIKEIVKNRSTSAMPTEISLANFIGAFFTLCYGFIIWDYIVIAPNFVGMVSGMIQIILLVLITNNDKIIVKEVDILEKQHFKPILKADLEM